MSGNVYINELRVPLSKIQGLLLLHYRNTILSAKHKRWIASCLKGQFQCVAFFEGNVLFCLPTISDIATARKEINEFLSVQVRDHQDRNLEQIAFTKLPDSSKERLLFEVLRYSGESKSILKLEGRTLFRPHRSVHPASQVLDVTIKTEDEYAKIHFDPSYVLLEPLEDARPKHYENLHLVGLCRHRSECPLADKFGVCHYVVPGSIGYFVSQTPLTLTPEEEITKVNSTFSGCPQIENASHIVRVKATKGAQGYLSYPNYVVMTRTSNEALWDNPELAKRFRDGTLMDSDERWDYTNKWISLLCPTVVDNNLKAPTTLEVGNIAIPIEALWNQPFPLGKPIAPSRPYSAELIREQQVVIDQSNPQPKGPRGGSAFSKFGSYDRDDVQRPFDKITPYFVVPTHDKEILEDARTLITALSNGKYTAHGPGDVDFEGISQAQAKQKYNCSFVNVWEEEEGVFEVDDSLDSYLYAVEEIIVRWHTEVNKSGRIAIFIVPERQEGVENDPFYYALKKRLVEEGIPSQFITTKTLSGISNRRIAFGYTLQTIWLNIYAKLGGIPWKLANELKNVHCFIGIGFGLSSEPIGSHIYAGVAHIFDKFGSWIDLTSGSRSLTDAEKREFDSATALLQGTASFKISQDVTKEIISDALRLYLLRQGSLPQNIVLHKLGTIHECEVIGFLDAIVSELGTLDGCQLGIVQIEQEHTFRLYGERRDAANQVVPRRTGVIFNNSKMALATTGANTRFGGDWYYPGIGTPKPLLLTQKLPASTILKRYRASASQFYQIRPLAEHIVALSQLHWGSTKENIRLPITTLYAQMVADFISKTGARINNALGLGSPWFL